MTQEVLPFPEWRVPAWAVWCFQVANASEFGWVREIFYPFKDEFLRRHAVPDGWDLQVLNYRCWTCEGTGVFAGWDDCWDCHGTGIYRTRRIVLWRWRLRDAVFHSPEPDGGALECLLYSLNNPPRATITERIEHKDRGWWLGVLAGMLLFLRYDPPRAWQLLGYVRRNAVIEFPPTYWMLCKIWWPLKAMCKRIHDRIKFGNQQDVPF